MVSTSRVLIPQLNTTIKLKKEDYPMVRFWKSSSYEGPKGQDTADPMIGSTHRSGGRALMALGINKWHRYIENEDGTIIDGHEVSAVNELGRSLFTTFYEAGVAKPKWSDMDYSTREVYYQEMCKAWPQFRLCKDNWKLKLHTSKIYSGWAKSRQLIKLEPDIKSEDIKTEKTEKTVDSQPARTSIPAKRRNEESDSIGPGRGAKKAKNANSDEGQVSNATVVSSPVFLRNVSLNVQLIMSI